MICFFARLSGSGAHDKVWPMTTKNPFPGMNPFFEQRWRDAHTRLIAYICDALQDRLPRDLIAGAEEEVIAIGTGELAKAYRPDVQVRQPWTPEDAGGVAVAPPPPLVATDPVRVFIDDEIERWLEIHDETGELITVLELLSPGNKDSAAQRSRYENKRGTLISGRVNLVEIDLVREGESVFAPALEEVMVRNGACYGVSVLRQTLPKDREFYPIRLRDRLPVISVPLRPTDDDVLLDLQPLIDQCHERGRYYRLRYQSPLRPPLPPEDAAWVDQLLREHGLR
jgi:hypothetical protein